MKIEILWAMFLVTTAFGVVIASDIPLEPDMKVDDFMIPGEDTVMDYSNYTRMLKINRQLGTCLGKNVPCKFDGQYLPHPDLCNMYCRCTASSATTFTPVDMPCPLGTVWLQSMLPEESGCIVPPDQNCARIGSSSNTCDEDSNTKCAKWAANGKCSKGKIYMKCKSSCACGIDGNPPCEDTKRKCSSLAAKGKCSKGRIYRQCKASCGCGPKPPVSCTCGTSKHINRIIGGIDVTPKQKYPWQVGIRTPGKDYFIGCGGSIINNRYVLTAAHCIYKHERSQKIWVHIGEHDQVSTLDDDRKGNTRIIGVKSKLYHPCYACLTVDFDFALLELDDLIVFNDVIKPVCLPEDDSETYVGEDAIVAGWGDANNVSNNNILYRPDKLREVDVTILDNNNCGNYSTGEITSNMLCAGDLVNGGKDSCQGDSGGPLIVKDPKSIGKTRHIQVGIVSFGEGCGMRDYAGVYSRVSKVLDWIKENTASGQYCDN